MPEVEMFMVGKAPHQRGRTKGRGSIFRKIESGTFTFQGQELTFDLKAVNCTINNRQASEKMAKLGYRCPTDEEYTAGKEQHPELMSASCICHIRDPEAKWKIDTVFLMIKK
jgi:hypothetical protein